MYFSLNIIGISWVYYHHQDKKFEFYRLEEKKIKSSWSLSLVLSRCIAKSAMGKVFVETLQLSTFAEIKLLKTDIIAIDVYYRYNSNRRDSKS